MFDEKEIKAYQSIKAPDSLREAVLHDANPKKAFRPRIQAFAALAAAFVLAITALVAVRLQPTVDVSIQSEPKIASERVYVPVDVKLHGRESTIEVSNGQVEIFEGECPDAVATHTPYTTGKDVCLWWYVDDLDEDDFYELTIRRQHKTYIYRLRYDDENKLTIQKQ